jgi:N12 class adenine-specific DNA methylase
VTTKRRSKREILNDVQFGFFGSNNEPLTYTVERPKSTVEKVIAEVLTNFRIDHSIQLGGGSPETKAKRNLEAIRIIKALETEERTASQEEREKLVQYVGWGALSKIFDREPKEWSSKAADLRALITNEEWRKASASTPNAHYTSTTVIKAIYRILSRFGFNRGLALEPAAGVGHFIGLTPEESEIAWTAVEMDPISGKILEALYPEASIHIKGFEDTTFLQDYFDAAIGNVPFGSYSVYDAVYNPNRFRIHDYFFVRSLAHVRPGGLIAMITSRGTMDKVNSDAREQIAEQANLLGALRLPNNSFTANAGTQVTTDLLLLQKRSSKIPSNGIAWMDLAEYTTEDGTDVNINEYYVNHPEMMLGELAVARGLYNNNEITLKPSKSESFETLIENAIEELPKDIYEDRTDTKNGQSPIEIVIADENVKENAFALINDTNSGFLAQKKLVQKINGIYIDAELKNEKDVRRVTQLTKIRDAVRWVLKTQNEDMDENTQENARQKLNQEYDHFVTKFGPINYQSRTESKKTGKTSVRYTNLQAFRQDPDAMLVAALEIYDEQTDTAEKAAIFSQRVIRPRKEITACDTAEDALLICLDRVGRVDLKTIGDLWHGKSEQEVIDELLPILYKNPETDQWETDDKYLADEVREKLRIARIAAEANTEFQRNVEALEQVQPEELAPSDIEANLGAAWIPPSTVIEFAKHLLGPRSKNYKIEISKLEQQAAWKIKPDPMLKYSIEATSTWGTARADVFRLLEDSLNQRTTQIYDSIKDPDTGKRKSVRNVEESLNAQEKQSEVQTRFAEWIWEDLERSKTMVNLYNTMFNGTRLRQFNGKHLTFQGTSAAIIPQTGQPLTLDPHQKNVIWQILQTGNTLMAHTVGAGKTFAMIAAGMKIRELNFGNKILHVTMNHMLEQYSREFIQLYPNANLLIASAQDFVGEGRKRFLARATMNDYDAIIMTHSTYAKIGMSREFQIEYMENEIMKYEMLLNEAKESADNRLTVKQIETALKNFEVKLEALTDRKSKDDIVTFEELGIDFQFIDEAHLYKNLDTPTKIQGIPKASKPSKRATDLQMKCLYLEQKNPGFHTVFATGTPISNTIAEVFVMLLYLKPDLLTRKGIIHFDGFAGTFIKRVPSLELAPDGGSYRLRTRFHFTNVAELATLFRTVADVQMAESYYENNSESDETESSQNNTINLDESEDQPKAA